MELRAELEGKRIAILVDTLYQEMEVWYPLFRLQEAGAEVVLVAAEAGKTYTSKLGYPAKSDRCYDTLSAKDFDGVVIPGGYAPDHMRRSEDLLRFVRGIDDQGKTVAAICHAPWVTVSAGIMKGRRATCVPAIKDDVINAGAEYVDQAVVVDGNLITSRRPDDLPAFLPALIELIAAQES